LCHLVHFVLLALSCAVRSALFWNIHHCVLSQIYSSSDGKSSNKRITGIS
jgi:hypothetical protein